ncbi:MAG: hypothetical protein IPN29_05245 [Saprospiraceae bacterium]|nr:hypothetical protein [Saprospiraceae bacterium]
MTKYQQQMFKLPSPIQEVQNHHFGFPLFVKREDLIHPVISGNKYRKLKYNLQELEQTGYHGIISFGGVFSNHLHALAGVSELYNISAVAILRGKTTHQIPPWPTSGKKG